MKLLYFFIHFLILLTIFSIKGFSQKISIGVLSGINFSFPKGEFTSGKWVLENGPVVGIDFQYHLNKVISLQTEISYTALQYKHLGYSNSSYISYYGAYPLDYIIARPYPLYYNNNEKWELSFFRVPLMAKFSTPTRLKFELAGGIYMAFLNTHSYTGPDYLPSYSYGYDSYYISIPAYSGSVPHRDFGYIISTGVSYPVSKVFKASLTGRYITGRKKFFEYTEGKNGSFEINMGLSYSGLFSGKTEEDNIKEEQTSPGSVLFYLAAKGGIILSGVNGDNHNDSYSGRTGKGLGISLVYPFTHHLSAVTELSYERKGYKMDDISGSYFRYTENGSLENKTLIDLDYVVVPLLLRYSIGNRYKIFINTGPYMAFLMAARVTGTSISEYAGSYGYNYSITNINDRLDGNIKGKDIGWIAGGGFGIPLKGDISLELECRYNTGMWNILEKSVYQAKNSDDFFKNNSLSITAGIVFPISKSK